MTTARRVGAVLALVAAPWLAPAHAAPDSDAAERARIGDERRAVEARFEAARRDCEARFVVTTCLADARQQRRDALEPLQRQLHLLDDARRRERAAERLQSIRERESAAAARPALAAASSAAVPGPAAAAPAQPAVRRAVRPKASASAASADAQRRVAQQQQRLQDAQAHEQAVKERNARHDAQHKPAAGLPVPVLPGASAP